MKRCSIFMLAIIIAGCGGNYEESTTVNAYINNTTSHNILIKPFVGGLVQQQYVINLVPGAQKQIAAFMMLGKSLIGGGFYSDYISNADSIIVIFNGADSISHYRQHTRFSPKNLLNIESYQGFSSNESKYHIHHDYYYVFTGQHYLDAQ